MGNKSTHSVGGARRGAGRETMMGAAECSGKTDGTRKRLLGHWVPFAVWVGVILLLQVAALVWTLPRWIYPVSYAAKSLVCAALLLYFRPWRGQPGLRATDWALGLLAGVLVAVLWILPETPWAGRLWPGLQAFYYRWLVFPPGRFPSYLDPAIFPELPYNHPSLAYSPAEAGWVLAVLKLLGSAGVIAVIEEYFSAASSTTGSAACAFRQPAASSSMPPPSGGWWCFSAWNMTAGWRACWPESFTGPLSSGQGGLRRRWWRMCPPICCWDSMCLPPGSMDSGRYRG